MGTTKAEKFSRRDMFKMAIAASAPAALKFPSPASAAQTRAKGRPNILFIMADQHRGDCLGVDGNPDIRTPNLDTIAKEGVRFRNAYSSTPSCIPARTAILTGLSPWHHGLLGMDGWPIPVRYPLELPRALHDAGYFTAIIGKNHFYPPRESHGYDMMLLDEHHDIPAIFRSDYHSWFWDSAPDIYSGDGVLTDVPDGGGFGWNDFWNAYQAKAYPYPERLHRTRWVGKSAVTFLRTYHRPQPFFLKVSFIPPHSPYLPPERLMRQYTDGNIPPAVHARWSEKYRQRSGPGLDIWHGDLGPEQVHRSRAGYYGQVTFVDEQIGHILEELDARKWLEETLIFYCADHGDMLGDHNLWRKGYPYQPSVRIPMLMRWPTGLVNAERGRVIPQTTELRDLLPTFLEAASAPVLRHVDGQSLLQLAAGKANEWRPYIELEHDVAYSPTVHWNAFTDGHTKYIFHAYDGSEQLFDLDQDPHEIYDLASNPDHQSQLSLWRGRMTSYLAVRGNDWVKNGKLMLRRHSIPLSPHYPRTEAKQVVIVHMEHGEAQLPHEE
jgi:arylsulfatase